MKPAPTSCLLAPNHHVRLRPIILPSPPVKLGAATTASSKTCSLKMKSSRKRISPKHTPAPLPSISTLFESTSSSLSSSSSSSYGSYCQFSPEGTYTMYQMPSNYDTIVDRTPVFVNPPICASVDEHKPVTQPLFIQTSDFGGWSDPSYPVNSTVNARELLLRPVPNC